MKLLIFGATGTVGSQLVDQALTQGHRVTAFARNPAVLKQKHRNLDHHAGDVLDPRAVASAVAGHDAVVIALGAGARGGIRSQGTQHVIQAMGSHQVRRLICLSSLGVGDSRGNLNFLWKHIMFGLLLRRAYADHIAQERVVEQSGLDWTIVRPGGFVDGDISGNYQHGFAPDAKGLKLKVSRADVASFMLQQLTSNNYLRQSPGVSY